MSRSPNQLPLRQEHDRSPAPLPPTSEKTSHGEKEGTLSKALGLPLPSQLREPEDTVLSPPTDNLQEPPETSSPRQSARRELGSPREEEDSFPLPLLQPQKEVISASPKIESSFPSPPLGSPLCEAENTLPLASSQPPPAQKENDSKSLGRDGPIVVTHLRFLLENAESPISQSESSPENPAVANRMAASKLVVGGGGKGLRVESGFVRRAALKRAEIGLRVSEIVFCAVSFSVMAADRTGGWAGDSFDRYLEFRYCFSMSVIAFAYSGFQVCAQIHHWIMKRHIISRPLSYYFNFSMDQVLAYLLLSASSSAATRNDDWVSMFGSDKFTNIMNGSITVTFLAFLAFSISSIISAYELFVCNT